MCVEPKFTSSLRQRGLKDSNLRRRYQQILDRGEELFEGILLEVDIQIIPCCPLFHKHNLVWLVCAPEEVIPLATGLFDGVAPNCSAGLESDINPVGEKGGVGGEDSHGFGV